MVAYLLIDFLSISLFESKALFDSGVCIVIDQFPGMLYFIVFIILMNHILSLRNSIKHYILYIHSMFVHKHFV